MRSPFFVRRVGVASALIGVIAAITALGVFLASHLGAGSMTATEAGDGSPAALHSVSAATGSLVGGEIIVITGTALTAETQITFGGVPASAVEVIDSENLTVTVPASADYQPATVIVGLVSDAATASSSLTYTYAVSGPVDRQMRYLMAHWSDYNVDDYGDLNAVGGDCANFVSQSLLERGWKMSDDWFSYDSGADWSAAWGYVPSLENWLQANPDLGATVLDFDQRSEVKVGDLVVFDWNDNDFLDHIQVVSAVTTVNGVTTIAMVGHNLDSNFRDFDDTITVEHPDATGHFWSIP
ncbi:MAG: amidase domain-containing protein [Rhodoglobus sp.]